ncbi:lytic transglycosylase domain-containing protein [Aeromicrobium sp.]|uniref:lytic transglycosylase domain-containing protein n=1 Tax=Aeromicrobium sp. TaxID=1871063 RepID=UPI003C69B537
MARQLSRLQKASALVPMAVLVGAWGAALTNSGLAIAVGGSDPDAIPDVPSSAFDQPATVQKSPGGIDPRAGADGAVSTLSTNGIPSAALFSYRRAETLLSKADASCKLPWNLVAALGRVESNHGRSNGNALSADGLAEPGIFGAPLNGNGVAKISDTDNGSLDKDTVWDRAVGPMQFIPGTWANVGVDSDNDGKKNPQDIDDAATAAGIYLCAGSDDLSTDGGARAAVHRYNHSDSYVDLVMKISAAYANGEFSQSPDGYPSSSIITSQSNDQTLGPKARAKAKKDQQQAENPKPGTGSGGTGSGGTGGTPTPTPTPPPVGGGTGGGGGTGTGGGGTGSGAGTVVDGVLTVAEKAACLLTAHPAACIDAASKD